ncbi:MAG: hypothetical protein V3R86_02140 [Candidatus Hydrothermarchaeaceae archaeon]
MSVSSVKVYVETKKKFDRLQAEFVLRSGEKLSQQDILDRIVDFATRKKERFFKETSGIDYPLEPEEIKRILKSPKNWGVKTREKDIDKLLYQ